MRWWAQALIGAAAASTALVGSAYWFRFYLPEPERTYTRMHDAACRGDADAFFGFHDLKATREAMTHHVVKQKSKAGDLAEAIVDREWDNAMDGWREDIEKKRWNGDVCAWEVVAVRESLYGGTVEVRQRSGKRRHIKIRKFGEGPFASALVVESIAVAER